MNKKRIIAILAFSAALAVAGALAGCGRSDDAGGGGTMTLTNVSYDPTRELYKEYNELFQQHYRETTGKDIRSSSPMADRAVRPGRSSKAARPMS